MHPTQPILVQELSANLFADLSRTEAEHVVRRLRTRAFRQGQFIFSTGQRAHTLFLLCHGLVKVSYGTPNGDTVILEICEAGDIFGELFLGDYRFRIGHAEAMTDCTVCQLSEDDLYQLINEYPSIGVNFIRHQADSQRRTLARMHALQRSDARARLLGTLLSLARTMCCAEGTRFQLHPAITQQDLADLTGLNRSTVSSLINRLRAAGILGGSGRSLTIDLAAVEAALRSEGFELLE